MKRTSLTHLGVVVIASLLAPAPAMSAGNYLAMLGADNGAMSALPAPQTLGEVTFVSGGIGKSEAAAMRRERSAFPLSLEFVERAPSGAQYLADIEVTIRDQKGNTVLDTLAEGPFLLARLPDGRYTVTADNEGQVKNRHIVVAERKPERVVFEW